MSYLPKPKLTYQKKCSHCEGWGHIRVFGKLRKCIVCNGKGTVEQPIN